MKLFLLTILWRQTRYDGIGDPLRYDSKPHRQSGNQIGYGKTKIVLWQPVGDWEFSI